MAQTEPQHLLSGYTVLDFTQVLAGPTVTRLMAEMGAEIIKTALIWKLLRTAVYAGVPYVDGVRRTPKVQQMAA